MPPTCSSTSGSRRRTSPSARVRSAPAHPHSISLCRPRFFRSLARLLTPGAAVIEAVTETIQDGLESDEYEFDWDGEVTGLVPYFGDDWENLPEGAYRPCPTAALAAARASQC